eukprot:9883191-Alexandrium_andersonii.AAC.1
MQLRLLSAALAQRLMSVLMLEAASAAHCFVASFQQQFFRTDGEPCMLHTSEVGPTARTVWS